MNPPSSRELLGSDGLRARSNGSYAKTKLEWMERYLRGGLSVAARKIDRVYVDLFAGPGLSVDDKTGEEFESGALRAVKLVSHGATGTPFTDAFLVNLDKDDHAALLERIERMSAAKQLRIPRHRIRIIQGDANVVVHDIMARVHPLAWIFVFADIEAPSQLPFGTVSALKMSGHSSVDLYALFPLHMGLQRLMSWDRSKSERYFDGITEYFGTPRWMEIYDRRYTDEQSREFRRDLEHVYCQQLQLLWKEASRVARIVLSGDRALYHMLFAASNEAALRLAEGVTRAEERDSNPEQPSLFG